MPPAPPPAPVSWHVADAFKEASDTTVGNDGTMKVLQPASRGGEPLLRLSPLAPSSLPADQQQPLLSAAQLEALVEQERSMLSADLEVGKAMEAHDQLERCATFNPRYSILYLVRHAVCTT